MLADYLLSNPGLLLEGASVLELGAGPGVAGMVAGRWPCNLILTGVCVCVSWKEKGKEMNGRFPIQELGVAWPIWTDRVHFVHACIDDALCTRADTGAGVLNNLAENVSLNHERLHPDCAVAVRQLDWLSPPDWLSDSPRSYLTLPGTGGGDGDGGRDGDGGSMTQSASTTARGEERGRLPAPQLFAWSDADVEAIRAGLQYIFAADCCYENHLTEGWMRLALLLLLMRRRGRGGEGVCGRGAGSPSSPHALGPGLPHPKLLVAVERRPCFTLREMGVRAPAYDYWRGLFEAECLPATAAAPLPSVHPGANPTGGAPAPSGGAPSCLPPQRLPASVLQLRDGWDGQVHWLKGRRVEVGGGAVMQRSRVAELEPVPELELWELDLCSGAAVGA